ncbi:metallophosphoesterase family protein [Psychromonas sp. MME2]|uniref:metallophosphoesterase family protein n=1 Tax=unclassified Psychromonas TaxID=2614957 RepID=UPI00339D02CC
MRIAVLSDIHSNVYALGAVLSDVRRRGVDFSVNLGDILYGPIAPRATFDLLMENELITIRGNQERQIYEAKESDIASNPTLQFILNELGNQPLKWMKQLPFNYQLNESIFLCHGTPVDDLIYLLENVDSGYAKVRSDQEIVALLNGQSSEVILCGHTHTARTLFTSTQQLIVNPGSVGLPAYRDDQPVKHVMESFTPHATYAIVECYKNRWSVQHIKIAYDYEKAANEALKRNRNDWAYCLTTGRSL